MKMELGGLESLEGKKDIMIFKVDKRNYNVVLYKSDYLENMNIHVIRMVRSVA
jgi:hypothetical protein